MNQDMNRKQSEEMVRQAKQSFEKVLSSEKYANIIKDDKHLKLLLEMVVAEEGNILDIGTGNGYLAFPLAQVYPDVEVYGLDIAEKIIEKNTAIAVEKNITNIHFQAFNGIDYPFQEGMFDFIVTRFALHHFPQIKEAIKTLSKLLKTGGKILIADPLANPCDKAKIIDRFMEIKGDGHVSFYTEEELEGIFGSCGMIVEKKIITNMKFPFPAKEQYQLLFERMSETERNMYQLEMREGIVKVGHIDVGNIIFTKIKN